MLKLYAPDRYLMYVVPLAALLFFSVPAGLSLSALQPSGIRRVLKAMALVVVLSFVPLVRGAGLFDYRDKAGLYAFLGTLPKEAVIAAHPVTADAIPAFSRRKVFANAEMGVPLYDAYWQEMKSRTFEVLSAYYAAGMKDVQLFVRRNGITHFVIDREQFTPAFMSEGVYVEPFASRIKDRTRGQKDFALLKAGRAACIYDDGRFCVLAF
jgi:hypothetical protein